MESLWRKRTGKIIPQTENCRSTSQHKKNVKVTQSTSVNEKLHQESKTDRDVIVIGAGLTGILTAWYLQEQGKNVLVLEAKEVASGQTERTTAKITSQHGLKYAQLIRKIGMDKARLYAQANEAAIEEYERVIKKYGIACEFERVSAYLYSMQNVTLLKEEAKAAAQLGIDARFTTETELPFSVAGAVEFQNQAQFSPLDFIKPIASTLDIWEYVKVISMKGNRLLCERMKPNSSQGGIQSCFEISADNIIVATHYPLKNVPGFYFLRQHQERSYVLALTDCKKVKGMYLGIDEEGISVRQAGDCLLLGGSSRRTGENTCGGAYDFLEQVAGEYYPEGKEVARWAAQDCMPHDGIPFIGRYSYFTPHLYVASGFQKWGMTTAMVAAMLLRDEICGVENPYAKLFSPQRLYVRAGMIPFLKDICVSVKGLFQGLFLRPRCPHMGCKLVWNPEEKSWDCPCHGSRFDEDGKILDNPSKKDSKVINVRKK